ncbi:MAG: 1,6-anhydro-N-acetylmuramyl-L-alanine amidase AmpD [Gammaproteobacteria bacterium]
MNKSRAASPVLDASGQWLRGVRRSLSPNRDRRPPGTPVSMLVVHGISLPAGVFGGRYVEDLFLNRLDVDAHPSFADLAGLRVSAHLLIDRAGSIVQFVPFDERAWHAGKSSFEGIEGCNDFSIGVELEGTDEVAYSQNQYRSLAAVCTALMQLCPSITRKRIVGHSDSAPGRKTDPGPAFDWSKLMALLR